MRQRRRRRCRRWRAPRNGRSRRILLRRAPSGPEARGGGTPSASSHSSEPLLDSHSCTHTYTDICSERQRKIGHITHTCTCTHAHLMSSAFRQQRPPAASNFALFSCSHQTRQSTKTPTGSWQMWCRREENIPSTGGEFMD